MSKQEKLIGKEVTIKTRESADFGNWGIIKSFDGEYFHIAMNNDDRASLVFDRSEFTVSRKH